MPSDQSLTFSKLQLGQWRQFAAVDVDFHPQLTVLTGENGVGKSTLLNIIARHIEDDLSKIVKKYELVELTESSLKELRNDLKNAGLSELFPEALVGLSRAR